MKPTLPITQSDAKALLGGTAEAAAAALGYQQVQGFYKLHEPLPYRTALAVIGAWYLQQQAQADHAPAPRPTRPVKRHSWLVRRSA